MVDKIFNWLNLAMYFLKIIATPLGDSARDLVILCEKLFMPSVLVLKLVVVNTNNSNHELINFNSTDKQQQLNQLVTHEEVFELQKQLAEVLVLAGKNSPQALAFAKTLIAKYGYQLCFNQKEIPNV